VGIIARITGKNEVASDVIDAVILWAKSSQQLLDVLESGSIISASDRVLVIRLIRSHLDSPAQLPEEFDVDELHALEYKLMRDSERVVQTYSEESL
jgi:hypothetical protein